MFTNSDPSVAGHPVIESAPESLLAVATSENTKAGQVLFSRGERPRKVLFVATGEVHLIRVDRGGKEIVLQRCRDGFLAEASIDASVYHCDAVVTAAGTVVSLPIAGFKRALDECTAFHRAWSSNLAREVRRLRARCEWLCLNSAAERITHYIESEGRSGTVTLSQSRKAWATELGLSHESLYRNLKVLETKRKIQIRGDTLKLL